MTTGVNDLEGLYNVIRLREQAPLGFDPESSALAVIDLQRYFTEPDHPLGRVMDHLGVAAGYFDRVTRRVLPNTRTLLDAFRSLMRPVYFTAFGTGAGDGSDLPPYMQGFDRLGMTLLGERVFPSPREESWRVDERVAPLPDETVLHKATASAFVEPALEGELRARGVRWLVVAGVLTECCVGQTARDAAERGFDVIVVDDACTGVSDAAHRILVDSFASIFGHRKSTADMLGLLAASRRGGSV